MILMTFVGSQHPMFNIIKAVHKTANVVASDAPEARHLQFYHRYSMLVDCVWKVPKSHKLYPDLKLSDVGQLDMFIWDRTTDVREQKTRVEDRPTSLGAVRAPLMADWWTIPCKVRLL